MRLTLKRMCLSKSKRYTVGMLALAAQDQSEQIQVSTNELAALKTSFAELEAKLTASADEADTKIVSFWT